VPTLAPGVGGFVEFLILGPLEVLDDDGPLPLGGAKQRAALAILLLHRNEVVSRDHLIDGIWAESPPPSATHTLETYMSRLRKGLHQDGEPERILTRAPGYLLRVDAGELDLERLEILTDRGKRALAANDPAKAAGIFREGLALFRGAPLEDLAYSPFARDEVSRLEDLRILALEQRIDADLALGRHPELVGELEALTVKAPLRERFWGQLMLALYRSDRQGEALGAFDRARLVLAEQLGVDPGPSLRQLHEDILKQDVVLDLADTAAVAVDVQVADQAGEGEATSATGRRMSPAPTRPHRLDRRRRKAMLLVGVLAVVVATAAALVPVVFDGGETAAPGGDFSPGLALIDAGTGEQIASIPRSQVALPCGAGYSEGHFWVVNCAPRSLVEIGPETGAIVTQFSQPHDGGGASATAGQLSSMQAR